MATSFSDIYDIVISIFSDNKIAELAPENQKFLFDNWLLVSVSSDAKEVASQKPNVLNIDFVAETLGDDLTYEEKSVIAKAMALRWATYVTNDRSKLTNHFKDRDFSTFNPSSMLSQLKQLKEALKIDLKESRERYDFDNWGDW
jgi:hypothetical protein